MIRSTFLTCMLILIAGQSLLAQNISGDWMSTKAEFVNGEKLPSNHHARFLTRYIFDKSSVSIIMGNQSNELPFKTNNGELQIGPTLRYTIEEYNDNALTLVSDDDRPVRSYLVPTDSFTVSGIITYKREVVNEDTVFFSSPGIEPLFESGNFLRYLMETLSGIGTSSFKFTYVIKSDGSIGPIDIQSSINEKQNKSLIKAIQKTNGKWKPGCIGGKPVSVKLTTSFSTTRTSDPPKLN